MTLVDWVVLLLVVVLAIHGYARGFVVGAMSLVGFVVGAIVGARIGPLLLSGGAHSPYAALFGLGGALIFGALLGALFEGLAVRVRTLMRIPGMRMADGVAGAVLTGCIGLGIAWVLGAAMVQSSGQFKLPQKLRSDIEDSAILRTLDGLLPPSGPILNALARVDPLPAITGPKADVPAPNPKVLATSGVTHASGSVVKILGQACGLGIEGSGWFAGSNLVVTNAHVVAGERSTVVQVRGGPGLEATPILFDPHDDIAVLRVPALRAPALSLASGPERGESGAILGYPQDGPFDARPGRLGRTQVTATQDAYGKPTLRLIASLRGVVRPGNSGGPLVNSEGRVIATVFAEITDPPPGKPGGFAVPDAVVAKQLAKVRNSHRAVSTQGCAD